MPSAFSLGEALLQRFQSISDIPLELRAELDRRPISCRELLELQVGSLLVLNRPTGENIDVYVGDVMIGTGEILVVDAALAVRVADLHELPSGFVREGTGSGGLATSTSAGGN